VSYVVRVRYPDGGGLTAEGRARRERVRLQAAELFVKDVPVPEIARRLRVSHTMRAAYTWVSLAPFREVVTYTDPGQTVVSHEFYGSISWAHWLPPLSRRNGGRRDNACYPRPATSGAVCRSRRYSWRSANPTGWWQLPSPKIRLLHLCSNDSGQ